MSEDKNNSSTRHKQNARVESYQSTRKSVSAKTITETITDHKQLLESKIKTGCTGLELVDWVQITFQCNEVKAIQKIKEITAQSANIIRELFDDNNVLLMAFDLYNRAVESGKIKDAALVLQSIMQMIQVSGKSNAGVRVQISEYIPEPIVPNESIEQVNILPDKKRPGSDKPPGSGVQTSAEAPE